MSCDQGFCKKFTNLIDAHLKDFDFPKESELMVFGKKSLKVLDRRGLNVREYKVINSVSDCESLALTLIESISKIFIHHFDTAGSTYLSRQIWPIKQHSNLDNIIDYDLPTLLRLYISYEIYFASIENGIKETTERSLATSEASENAERSANDLRKLYNKLRQDKITREVTAGE
jgi:F0F1-type ATP synthase gamma subunit